MPGTPARGYKRPPFAANNLVNLSHGARSPRVYNIVAQELVAGLLESRPDLIDYPEALAGWAQAEAQALLMRRHLEKVGAFDPETGEPRDGLLRWSASFEKQAAGHRQLLGLDPRSEASLARDRASAAVLSVDLAAIAERGRQALAARQVAEVGTDIAGRVLEAQTTAYAREKALVAEAWRESEGMVNSG